MLLIELLKNVNYLDIDGNVNVKVNSIAYNSENVGIGDLFICVSGSRADGHDYALAAAQKGAVAIVAEKNLGNMTENGVTVVYVKNSRIAMAQISAQYYGNPQNELKMLGVTGTNGKTTVTYLVKSILESCGHKVGLIGTNQNIIGESLITAVHTTPDSPELMKLLRRMADENMQYVVMEVSSHSLVQQRVAACHFVAAAFTNITQEHLDFHGTMQNYLSAKAKIFELCDIAIINADDEAYKYLAQKITKSKLRTISYGVNSNCDLKADNIVLESNGVAFDINVRGAKKHIELKIPGEFSVYNALTAAAICWSIGMSLEDISKGIKSASGVKGRCETVDIKKDYSVIIDYAHTPDGLLNVLKAIKGFAKGRVVTVFGCGGDRDVSKRAPMGKVAGENSDFCVITSDNPRSENPMSIIKDILEGINTTNCNYVVVENRFSAIEYALSYAEKGDVVLLAGKGHETYQVLSDRIINFDEREIVIKLLA